MAIVDVDVDVVCRAQCSVVCGNTRQLGHGPAPVLARCARGIVPSSGRAQLGRCAVFFFLECIPAVLIAVFAGPCGISVLAPRLDEDTTIVTCPFSLIITKHAASQALETLLGHPSLDAWSERQLICSYLCFHRLCPEQRSIVITPPSPTFVHGSHDSSSEALRHFPYIQCLPPAADLLTPLHFTTAEREILRGTNLYGATSDRERDLRTEWVQCRSLVHGVNPAWADAFTWFVIQRVSESSPLVDV